MANDAHSKIEGHDKVVLKLTFGHTVTLTNVKHVPNMRKNLIFGTLMSKHGFTTSFKSEKLILRKNSVFLCKEYAKRELVKVSMNTIPKTLMYIFLLIQ